MKFIIELHREAENFDCKNPSTQGDTERRWFCLEQLLNKLLREQHEKYTSLPPPHPTIATMGMTRKQRTAVTKPYNRSRIIKMSRVGKSSNSLSNHRIIIHRKDYSHNP